MEPKAIRNHRMRRGSDGLLRLAMVDADREFVLDPLAEFIWDLADGSRDIDVLAEAASRAFDRVVEQEQIFSALDFLADAGLIEERVAPPAAETKVSRRSVLSRIVPVAGAAAWMMSGGSAKAAGLFQYNESDSKESSNKEYNRKADNRESSNKESNTKAGNREATNKESNTKAGNREVGDKERDRKADDKRDWDRQQAAEKSRKSEFNRTIDQINESERKHAIVREQVTQKMRASWPKLYDIVGHELSEIPELRKVWERASIGAVPNLRADNYADLFQKTQRLFFGLTLRFSASAMSKYASAGFDVPAFDVGAPPLLPGDSQKKTHLVLEYITSPAIGDNWRNALNADNLRFAFYDPEAAYQFLSSRRASSAQTKK